MVVRRWIFFTQKLSSFHTIFLGARKKIISKLVYTRSSHCNGYSLLPVNPSLSVVMFALNHVLNLLMAEKLRNKTRRFWKRQIIANA